MFGQNSEFQEFSLSNIHEKFEWIGSQDVELEFEFKWQEEEFTKLQFQNSQQFAYNS